MALWQRGRVNLVWSPGHPLHGLEISMRRRPMGEITEAWLTEPEEHRDWADLSPKERAVRTEQNVAELAELIVGWNYADDDGVAVTPDAAGLLANCDPEMINDMREAYSTATTRVSPPLQQPSDDGSTPGEWDLPPQETLATPVI